MDFKELKIMKNFGSCVEVNWFSRKFPLTDV